MIGYAVLWKIVGANLFFTAARTDLATALGTIFFRFFALLPLQQPRTQDTQRSFFIFDLASPILTTHDCAGRNVQDLDSGVGRVYPLTAGPTRTRDFNAQIIRLQLKINVLRFRQNRHRSC